MIRTALLPPLATPHLVSLQARPLQVRFQAWHTLPTLLPPPPPLLLPPPLQLLLRASDMLAPVPPLLRQTMMTSRNEMQAACPVVLQACSICMPASGSMVLLQCSALYD
jgi:hypothetical protein